MIYTKTVYRKYEIFNTKLFFKKEVLNVVELTCVISIDIIYKLGFP